MEPLVGDQASKYMSLWVGGRFTSKLWPTFSTKMLPEWFREGEEYIVPQNCLPCSVTPTVSFPDPEWIVPDWFLCYHGGFPCPLRNNTDKPSITAARNIRPGSSGRLKAWAVGHFARPSKLTAGTQMRVKRDSSWFVQRAFSLCGTTLSFIWIIWIIYFP